MKFGYLIVILSIFFVKNLFALSAVRIENETFLDAIDRVLLGDESIVSSEKLTAVSLRVPFKELEFSSDNDFSSYDELFNHFVIIRDKRFIEHQNMMRRPSWMFPHDGCWIRAELMNENLRMEQHLPLKKLFLFGDLKFKTEFSPRGMVTWWFHVAPIARVDGKVYILDPALNPDEPTLINDWILKQVRNLNKAEVSVCEPNTYSPFNDCLHPEFIEKKTVFDGQRTYLDEERKNLITLGLDVDAYLGDNPPWLIVERFSREL